MPGLLGVEFLELCDFRLHLASGDVGEEFGSPLDRFAGSLKAADVIEGRGQRCIDLGLVLGKLSLEFVEPVLGMVDDVIGQFCVCSDDLLLQFAQRGFSRGWQV